MTLDERIKELRELEAKATKGPWMPCVGSGGCECTGIHSDHYDGVICDFLTDYMLKDDPKKEIRNDMKFVVASRNAMPMLLDALEDANRKLALLRELGNAVIEMEVPTEPLLKEYPDGTCKVVGATLKSCSRVMKALQAARDGGALEGK